VNSSQVMKDEHSYMNENTQNSPKIVVTKYNFLHLNFFDKISIPRFCMWWVYLDQINTCCKVLNEKYTWEKEIKNDIL
jgi:hypothetical protein